MRVPCLKAAQVQSRAMSDASRFMLQPLGRALAHTERMQSGMMHVMQRLTHMGACFFRYGADSQAYGLAVGMFNQPSCEAACAAALRKVRLRPFTPAAAWNSVQLQW